MYGVLLRKLELSATLFTKQSIINVTGLPDPMNSSSLCCGNLVYVQRVQIIIHISFIVIASAITIALKYFTTLRFHDYKFLIRYPGHTFKWTISGVLSVVLFFSIAEGILTDSSRHGTTNPYLYVPQMLSLTSVIISLVYYHHMEYWDRPHLIWLLLLYWIMAIIGEVLSIFRVTQSIGFDGSIMRLDTGIVVIILYSCCAVIEINVLREKIFSPLSEDKEISKDIVKTNLFFMQSYANCLSNTTQWWVNWLVSLSHRRTIEVDDLGCLPGEFEGKHTIQKFNKAYLCEQRRCGKLVPSLWNVCWRAHYVQIIVITLARIMHIALTLVGPASIKGIVTYATQYYNNDIKSYSSPFVTVADFFSNGFILILLVWMGLVVRNILWVYSFGASVDAGIQLKTAFQNLVYGKILRLSSMSTVDTNAGKTINHMSVDVVVIKQFLTYLGFTISYMIQIVVVCIWLFYSMGLAGVVGVCFGILASTIALKTGRIQHKLQHLNMHYSDIRVKKTNELLQGIKLLKLCGWEELFASDIRSTRSEEMALKSKVGGYFLLSGICMQALPYVIALSMFGVYSRLNAAPLTPDIVFTALALINLLIQPFGLMLTFGKNMVQMLAACKRLEDFMSAEEMGRYADQTYIVDDSMYSSTVHDITEEYEMNAFDTKLTTPLVRSVSQHNYRATHQINSLLFTGTAEQIETSDVAVEIVNGYFSWERSTHEAVLNNINVKIEKGTLTIVVGKIGTGKSSLMAAILGEMDTISGSVTFNGKDNRIAYVAQKAWLQNASLRDNILFGETFVQEKYYAVLGACALNQDLHTLPGGDMAEIGEKGINISGGQKHRICLARALYSKSDLIILDDPLSALDVHVSAHVMENAILGYLREQQRTVILVTHKIQYLEHANQVLVMDNGQIIQKGNLQEIRIHNKELYRQWQELISTFSESENENENDSVIKNQRNQNPSPRSEVYNTTEKGSLVEVENPLVGAGWTMLYLYAKALKLTRLGVLMFVLLLQIAAFVILNIWISNWSQAGNDNLNKTTVEQEMVVAYYLPRYAIFICTYVMMYALTNACIIIFGISAAKRLFNTLLYNVMYSPIRFFETTPVGRLLNRFSADMRSVDESIWECLVVMSGFVVTLIGIYAVNAIISPYFIVLILLITGIGIVFMIHGVRLPRDIKRLEHITSSPVLSYFGETCTGLTTIRAFRAEEKFTKHMLETIDNNNLCSFYVGASVKWVSFRMGTIGAFLFLIFGIGAMLACINGNIEPSFVGLAVTTGMIGPTMLNAMLFFLIDLLNYFNGVERVLEYANIIPEEIEGPVYPSENWPNKGSINIQNITARYASTLDPVLNNVSIKIRAGEKIGICGRTGSGKSSLTLTLLRMINIIEGRIVIDGIDISTIPVLTLRRRMSIIPQDPVLFCGTLRFNLDPEQKYVDQDLWNALEIAQLKDYVLDMGEQLDTIVTEGGDNISTGQRQLICLARAFLRKSRILIMDEATASVDLQTDATLQTVIATAFSDKTVLTIAHRMSTILDSDTVLVLSEGRVVEYDTPQNLLRKDGSMFASLVNETR